MAAVNDREPVNEAKKAFNKRKLDLADFIRGNRKQLGLTPAAVSIGAELCSLTNFHLGYAWQTEKHIAQHLGFNDKTMKRAVAALQEAGVFRIERVGRNNRYRPVFEVMERGQKCPLSDTEKGTIPVPIDQAKGDIFSGKGDKFPGNRGQNGAPISLETSFGSRSEPPAGSGDAPDGAAVPASNPLAGTNDQLGGFSAALEARLGKDVFAGWLAKVVFVAEDGETLRLAAPSRFNADRLMSFYATEIIGVWRLRRPHIRRLEVAVAASLALAPPGANVASLGARRVDQSDDEQWLNTAGVHIVFTRLGIDAKQAVKTLWQWRRDAHHDNAGLRRILTGADAEQLERTQFSSVVREGIRALRNADQPPLRFGPEAIVKRSAS